ncbi:hypothetical protein C8R45DRAFT_1105176 [Mycena sanguinolenta]|nr:hypothetical protein C8R45DRAFT_1105176 [Mycena sanguinolenta]
MTTEGLGAYAATPSAQASASAAASTSAFHCIPGSCQRSLLTSVDIRGPPWIPFGEARRRQVSQIVLTCADAPLTSVDPASTNAADIPLHTTRLRQSSPTLTASGAAIADQNSCHGIY